jgi:Zn-dependent protease
LLAALAAIPLRLGVAGGILATILNLIVYINLILAVFNLIPLAPLDGSKVLWALMPSSWSRTFDQIQQYSLFILLALVLIPAGPGGSLLSQIINPPVSALYGLLLGF